MPNEPILDDATIQQRLSDSLPRWTHAAGHLERRYRTHGWKSTLMVVNAIGHLAEAAWHHPELSVAYDNVTVRLMTHSAQGITDKDVELARKIEETVRWRPGADSALEGTPDDPRYAYLDEDA